jgi:uncharacterized protein (TIGR03067 family)
MWTIAFLPCKTDTDGEFSPVEYKEHVMPRAIVLVVSIMAGCLLVGPVAESSSNAQAPVQDDAKAVQGTWVPVKAELAGQAMPDAVLKTIVLKLDQGKYEVSVGGKIDKGTCTQDPTTKPKRLSIRGTDGPNAGKTFLCIYEIDGDTFRVCYDLTGMKHPDDFATAKSTSLYLVTYTRKKD